MKKFLSMLANEEQVPLSKSKFTKEIADFDNLCEELLMYIPVVFFQFQWMKIDRHEDRIIVLRHLGFLLCRLLNMIKDAMELRQKVLCDEHCDYFEVRIRRNDHFVKDIKNFITDADKTIAKAVQERTKPVDIGVLRQFARFNGLVKWVDELMSNEDLLNRSAELCNKWELHYDVHLLAERNDNLRRWARTTLYCMTMLAVYHHLNDSDEELGHLFDNSYNSYLESDYWKNCEENYNYWLRDRFKKDLQTHEAQLQYVNNECKTLMEDITAYLAAKGISYNGIDTERKRIDLCKQLYAHLNGVNMNIYEYGNCEKNMTNHQLCQYFMKEAHLRFLNKVKEELEAKPTSSLRWENNGCFTANAPTDALRQAIFRTVTYKDKNGKQYFKSQALWIAVYNVLQHYGFVSKEKGAMKLFAELMAEDWMTAVRPLCDRDSLKNTKMELRKKDFKEWNGTLYNSYFTVAKILIENMAELKLISKDETNI